MPKLAKKCLLTINGGSSSIKFAVYEIAEKQLSQLFSATIKHITGGKAQVHLSNLTTGKQQTLTILVKDNAEAATWIISWLEKQSEFINVKAIGHRLVQGMEHTAPQKLTAKLIKQLKAITAYDPEHLPAEIKLIEVFRQHYPKIDQIACFDTLFHNEMPNIAKLIPIPIKYRNKGIKRYGFHGLSYAYLMQEFERQAGAKKAKGKIIIAHLGSGASLAAIKNGISIDTSMGFTPASGLTMSTRTGDLDPGVAWYLQKLEKLSATQFNQLVNHQSGLLAIAETTGDMEQLLKNQHEDKRSALAVDFFCYQCIKWIGAFTAVLGGLDTLIFSGGIGEEAPEIRTRICKGLRFLGVTLNNSKNIQNDGLISTDRSKVSVRVIKTNEELMIARLVCKTLKYSIKP